MSEDLSGINPDTVTSFDLVNHSATADVISRRIESTLPPSRTAVDVGIDPLFGQVLTLSEAQELIAEERREAQVYSELEARVPALQGMVREAILDTADALVGLDPLPADTPKKSYQMIERKNLIDNVAGISMIRYASQFDFGVEAHGEGLRDNRDNGQDVVIVEGELGKGEVEYVLETDAIDGTELAAKGEKRAISVAVLAPKDGLVVMEDAYFQKLVIPDSVEGVDVSSNPDDVFAAVHKDAGFETAEDRKKVIVYMLDRDANSEIEAAAIKSGATVIKFSGGDVLPIVSSGKQPDGTVRMMYTRGMGPELTIAAGIVTAINSSKREGESGIKLSTRKWSEDPVEMSGNEVLTHENIAPKGEAVAVIGFLTDDLDGVGGTGLKGVPVYTKEPIRRDQPVNMVTITRNGIEYGSSQRDIAA